MKNFFKKILTIFIYLLICLNIYFYIKHKQTNTILFYALISIMLICNIFENLNKYYSTKKKYYLIFPILSIFFVLVIIFSCN